MIYRDGNKKNTPLRLPSRNFFLIPTPRAAVGLFNYTVVVVVVVVEQNDIVISFCRARKGTPQQQTELYDSRNACVRTAIIIAEMGCARVVAESCRNIGVGIIYIIYGFRADPENNIYNILHGA